MVLTVLYVPSLLESGAEGSVALIFFRVQAHAPSLETRKPEASPQPKSETRNPRSEPQNPKSEPQNPKPGIRNPKSETWNPTREEQTRAVEPALHGPCGYQGSKGP